MPIWLTFKLKLNFILLILLFLAKKLVRECDFKWKRFPSLSAEIEILKLVRQRCKNPTSQLNQQCNIQGKLHCGNGGCKKRCNIFCITHVHSLFKKYPRIADQWFHLLYFVGNFHEVSNIYWKANSEITKNPGICIGAINSWHGWQCCWWRDMLCWTWSLKGRENWLRILAVGCSGHEMVEFRILRGKQQDSNLGLEESELWPVRAVLARIPWETTLEREELQGRWLVSNIISFSLKNGPFQWVGNQAIMTGRIHGWKNCSRFNACMKKTHVRGRSPVRWPRKNAKTQDNRDHSLFDDPTIMSQTQLCDKKGLPF